MNVSEEISFKETKTNFYFKENHLNLPDKTRDDSKMLRQMLKIRFTE